MIKPKALTRGATGYICELEERPVTSGGGSLICIKVKIWGKIHSNWNGALRGAEQSGPCFFLSE